MELSFELVITGMEHHTWQGILRSGETKAHFRSELELLQILDRLLSRGQGTSGEERGAGRWGPTQT